MKIFVISLAKSIDRRQHIASQFESMNIPFTFFDAVNGHEGTDPVLKHHDAKKRSWLHGKPESKGALGCFGSHYLLWEKCRELNTPVLILEDDISLEPSFKNLWDSGSLEQLLKRFGYLRLYSQNSPLLEIEHHSDIAVIKYFKNENGTAGYGLSPEKAKALINHSTTWIAPVDNYIGQFYSHGVEAYGITPTCISAPGDFGTCIQGDKDKFRVPLHKKITRELYTAWRKYRYWRHNSQFERTFKAKSR